MKAKRFRFFFSWYCFAKLTVVVFFLKMIVITIIVNLVKYLFFVFFCHEMRRRKPWERRREGEWEVKGRGNETCFLQYGVVWNFIYFTIFIFIFIFFSFFFNIFIFKVLFFSSFFYFEKGIVWGWKGGEGMKNKVVDNKRKKWKYQKVLLSL